MKLLIMGFTKMKYMPYINFYLDNTDKRNDIHILYWNRDLKCEELSEYDNYVLHEFRCYQEDDVSKISKIRSFVKYRRYAVGLIEKERFDFIFVLHSLPGVLIADVLKKKYSGKYILDYRDSTYEGFAPFKKIVGNIVECSEATFVSSDAFRCFLPNKFESKIYTSHNLLTASLDHRDEKKLFGTSSDKLRIAFWGFIRHEEVNKEIIRKIALDDRFELHYYGREQQVAFELKKYAARLKAENVFFHGEYRPEDRYVFVRNTDLIHNIYDDRNMMLAMGNKYYDAAIFRIPIVSIKGSAMAKRAEKAGIGISADPYEEDFTDKLYSAYRSMDKEKFEKHCDNELASVMREYTQGACFIRNATSASEAEKA